MGIDSKPLALSKLHSEEKELQVLLQVEDSSCVSQRQLSQQIGISLGLTNTVVRNLIKKGYLRSQKAGWRRWAYSLTPEGFALKFRLTVNYVRRFMDHYQNVREILRKQIEPLELHEESRVAILDTGEFAELIYLALKELNIREIDFFAIELGADQQFLGNPVHGIETLQVEEYHKVLLAGSHKRYQKWVGDVSQLDKVITFLDG